jgi:hypothetical protein
MALSTNGCIHWVRGRGCLAGTWGGDQALWVQGGIYQPDPSAVELRSVTPSSYRSWEEAQLLGLWSVLSYILTGSSFKSGAINKF